MKGFFRKIGNALFSDRSYERAERVDRFMKPVGGVCGSVGKILGAVGAVYTLGWARDRFRNGRREQKRLEQEEDIQKILLEYLNK